MACCVRHRLRNSVDGKGKDLDMAVKYKITLTENQLRIVQKALEEYFRLRLGQDQEFSEDMASLNTNLSSDHPNHERIFEKYIQRRDHLRELMHAYFRIAFEPCGYLEAKTDDMLIAEDIWDTIRCARGVSRWQGPLHVGAEPIPDIEVVE